jgi:hypothetical protein
MVALRGDGTVWAWGYNSLGQIGIGNLLDQPSPVQIPGIPTGIVAIAASEDTTFAIDSTGTVWACGSNEDQALGDPGETGSWRATMGAIPGLPPVNRICAMYDSAFAITPGMRYADFLDAYFTPTEQSDLDTSGLMADPDNDGVPNVWEYYHARHPRRANDLPVLASAMSNGVWRLTYTGLTCAQDFITQWQAREDLLTGQWYDVQTRPIVVDDRGDTSVRELRMDINGIPALFLKQSGTVE